MKFKNWLYNFFKVCPNKNCGAYTKNGKAAYSRRAVGKENITVCGNHMSEVEINGIE